MATSTNHVLTRRAFLTAAAMIACMPLVACKKDSPSTQPALTDCPVIYDETFGSVHADISIEEFDALGFNLGDAVDVSFSNGFQLKGIPYYNGYYTPIGSPLVLGYPGSPHIAIAENYGDRLWDKAGLVDGDTVTITLSEAGGYLAVQQAFDVSYTDLRSDYPSDEAFANFRALSGGNLKPNFLFRSASPIHDGHQRASYVEALMEAAGVRSVLDLSDNDEEIDAFIAEDVEKGLDVSYFVGLRDSGDVIRLDMSANYMTDDFKEALASGFIELPQHEGPYLIHCVEGKDRTGFACLVLEALAGATYDELRTDYMASFVDYYGVTEEKEPEKYEAILQLNLHGMLAYLAGDDAADLTAISYVEPARSYLLDAGMTDEQIDALTELICS